MADIPLVDAAYQQFVPLFATIELTLRCNLRCKHCYNFDRDRPLDPDQVARELTPPEIIQLIDDLATAGGLEISFSGGEALLHPHLEDFVRHARKHLFAVRIKSNGMLMQATRAERLAEAGVYAVDISLYGASALTHERLTAKVGSFDLTLAGIKAARDAGMRVSTSFCITRGNVDEIPEMIKLAEELGVTYTLDPQLTARYDGTTSSLDHRVDAATLEALYRGPLREHLGGPACKPDRDMSCSCAQAVVGISATGEVYPCIGAPMPSGNLRDASFGEIWRESPVLNKIRGLTMEDYPTCHSCADRPFCRRSNGVVFVNTGDYTALDEWTCMEANVLHQIHTESAATPGDAPAPAQGRLGKY
jgi:radical SAM protein with 4Fe4S-binding SPASM domain